MTHREAEGLIDRCGGVDGPKADAAQRLIDPGDMARDAIEGPA